MNIDQLFRAHLLRSAEGAGGGGAGDGAGGAGDPPPGDGGAGGGGNDTQAGGGGDGGAGDGAGGAKWWQADTVPEPMRQFLTAKGLTVDDPAEAALKLADIASNAEKRIGRGLDSILDRPKEGQALPEWLRANAATLGLPDKEDGYAVDPAEFWPKDMPWDTELEAEARKVAFETGVPLDAHKAYVGLFAKKMQALEQASQAGFAQAREQMMGELTRDYGDQTPAVIARARQAAQVVAQQANLSGEALEGVGQLLAEKTGDASTIRFMAAVAEALSLGEDSAVGLGKGGGLTMTPAEARAELSKLHDKGGEYFEATQAGNMARIKELQPRIEQLSKIAARG